MIALHAIDVSRVAVNTEPRRSVGMVSVHSNSNLAATRSHLSAKQMLGMR